MTTTPIQNPARTRFRRLRLAVFVAVVIVVAIVFYRPLFLGNFGAVDPGRVYRAAQPESRLEDTIRTYGIGAIANLRGGSEADHFYRNEAEVAEREGVEFYDLPLSASRRPTRRELILSLAILDRCRYPLLIHCKWGSDRTGFLSALYRLVVRGDSPEAALGEFSLAYGHFPIGGPEHLHEPFQEYARWLEDHGLPHQPARFRQWLATDYRSDDPFPGWLTIHPGRRTRKLDLDQARRIVARQPATTSVGTSIRTMPR